MRPLLWDSTDPATGQPYTWDSPKLTWSGILEPGDPGYQPPNRSCGSVTLSNFWNKLAGHAPALGISTLLCAAAIADARWLIYILGSWVRAWQKSCTDAVETAQRGPNAGAPMVLPLFVPPALPGVSGTDPAVVPVAEGALDRIFHLVSLFKEHDAYDITTGTDLGVEGSAFSGPNFATLRPELSAIISGGRVEIKWTWGGYSKFLDQCEIQVDRGDGQGWRVLTFDTTPGYTDTQPFPAAVTQWKYRAIYRVDDAQVGLWSEAISIAVGG